MGHRFGGKFDITKQAKIINIAVSMLMCAAGVLIWLPLLFPGPEKILIGVLYVVVGIAKLYGFFANDMYRLAFQFDLGIGALALIMGILFLAAPEKFDAAFSNSVGIYTIIEAMFKLQIGYDAKMFGMRYWLTIMIGALFLCAIGILTTIAFYIDALRPDLMLALALIAVGLCNAWVTMYTVRVRKKRKQFADWLAEGAFETDEL